MTLVAIDGRAGAGKTTLATKLAREWSNKNSVAIIHMDDLYNGWDDALSESLTYSLQDIVRRHLSGELIEYKKYNWITQQFDEVEIIEPVDILILEGVGAGQKSVRDAGASLYWLDIEPDVGITRVLNRDGHHIADEMARWMVRQELHFLSDKTRENAEHILSS